MLIKISILHRILFKFKGAGADTAWGIIVGEKLCDVFSPGDHGTTFAHSSMGSFRFNGIKYINEDGLMQEAYEMSHYFNEKQAIQKENSYYVQEVRHAG